MNIYPKMLYGLAAGSSLNIGSSMPFSRVSSATDCGCAVDKRHQICQKLLAITRQRIAETLSCTPEDLPELSLGRAINLLFLARGEALSLGEYGATMASSYTVVGDLLWKLPCEFPKHDPEGAELVQ